MPVSCPSPPSPGRNFLSRRQNEAAEPEVDRVQASPSRPKGPQSKPPEPPHRPARPPRGDLDARPAVSKSDPRPERVRPHAGKRPARSKHDPHPPRARPAAKAAAPPRERAHVEGEPARIAKLLARAGVASRRDIERMIAERRIAIDGAVVETPATILTSLKGVTVDGQPVAAPVAARLYLYHKPAGLLTAANDPAGRPTIYARLPKGLPRLMPVGRLDLNTEGLLLLTNDGELKRQLELPATGVERTYRARIFGDLSQETLEGLIEGIEIDGMRYGPIDANLERRTGRNGWVEMKLKEGKNREVRRVLEYLGVQVSRLIRTAYGPFVLGDLSAGSVGEVERNDLFMFRRTLTKSPSPSEEEFGVGEVNSSHAQSGKSPIRPSLSDPPAGHSPLKERG